MTKKRERTWRAGRRKRSFALSRGRNGGGWVSQKIRKSVPIAREWRGKAVQHALARRRGESVMHRKEGEKSAPHGKGGKRESRHWGLPGVQERRAVSDRKRKGRGAVSALVTKKYG